MQSLFVDEQSCCNLTRRLWDKRCYTFYKSISSKVNITTWLDLELYYNYFEVHQVSYNATGPVDWGGAVECTDCISAIGKDSSTRSLEYDTKQSDGEAPVILELWGMQSTHS